MNPAPNVNWRENRELVLEGGGRLPGASRVVGVREKVISCTASRENDKVLVKGEVQVFVYYNLADSDRIQGQGAEVAWHSEVPIPSLVKGSIKAKVVEVRHDHSYNPVTENLRHKMYLTFEVWSVAAETAYKVPKSKQPHMDRPPTLSPEEVVTDPEVILAPLPESAQQEATTTPSFRQAALGEAQGRTVQSSQSYEGSEPEWPSASSPESRESILEGEPALERGEVALQQDTASSHEKVDEGFEQQSEPATEPETEPELVVQEQASVDDTAAPSEEPVEEPPEPTPQVAEEEEPEPAADDRPVRTEEVITWRPFPKTDLPSSSAIPRRR